MIMEKKHTAYFLLIAILLAILSYYISNKVYTVLRDFVKINQPISFERVYNINLDDLAYVDKLPTKNLVFLEKEFKNKKKLKEKKFKSPPRYRVEAIFITPQKSYVIINGHIYTEGEMISPYERIILIEEGRVLLQGKWGKRWLYILGK